MKPTKHLIQLIVAALMIVSLGVERAPGQSDNRRVTLTVGEIHELTVSFPIRTAEPGKADLVQVQQAGAQKLSVTGLKEGQTDLKVTGDGETTEIFKITVVSSLDAVLRAVRKDLDSANILGLEAETSLGKVLLRGTITKPQDWVYLKKTILPGYGEQVQLRAQFRLQDELLQKMRSDLEKGGLKVVESGGRAGAPGQLNLSSSDNTVMISGSVLSRGELELINATLSAYPWLRIKKSGDKDTDDACYAVVNVTVAPVMLEVDVAFLGVTDSEATTLGANLFQQGLAVVQGTAAVVGNTVRGSQSGASYMVGSSLQGTLQALGAGGSGRAISRGHLTFRNDSVEWKSYQDGGTLILPVSNGVVGGSTVQPVDYGLILRVKGGLVDSTNAALALKLELSVPIQQGNSPAGPIYNLYSKKVDSDVLCPVGKTLIMAGTKELTEGVAAKSKVPILGDVPVLQFLFSEREKARQNRRVLILVSPQIAQAPTAAEPLAKETMDTQEKANQPISINKPSSK